MYLVSVPCLINKFDYFLIFQRDCSSLLQRYLILYLHLQRSHTKKRVHIVVV